MQRMNDPEPMIGVPPHLLRRSVGLPERELISLRGGELDQLADVADEPGLFLSQGAHWDLLSRAHASTMPLIEFVSTSLYTAMMKRNDWLGMRIDPTTKRLLAMLAELDRVTMSEEVRLLVTRRAIRQGISIRSVEAELSEGHSHGEEE